MLAWRRMNTLQLHFSENEGFRIESERFPQIVSARHLTQDEVRDLVAYADRYHVTVISDIDMPGHLRQVLTRLRPASGCRCGPWRSAAGRRRRPTHTPAKPPRWARPPSSPYDAAHRPASSGRQ
ncbi:hypothetical protein GCM10025872_31750 [Barrientosiimonas endolithica]|uniref:beta-N-acetylhexosaminidase n=1 Tax=Barrientosiimonas endolithica TaxID=1535208 RepID=A0ABN6YQF3_9MICO|nr:hypothetical protein GCM10025872_31750 [Barrientosiimonas endolithica]